MNMTAVIRRGKPARDTEAAAMANLPLDPRHPERICWGCDRYCPDTDLACGNGTVRTQHPVELFGDDWLEWAAQRTSPASDSDERTEAPSPAPKPAP